MSTPGPDRQTPDRKNSATSVREVTPTLLRSWPPPAPSGSKYGRGQVLIVGGAATTPGAVQLAGLAALRGWCWTRTPSACCPGSRTRCWRPCGDAWC